MNISVVNGVMTGTRGLKKAEYHQKTIFVQSAYEHRLMMIMLPEWMFVCDQIID